MYLGNRDRATAVAAVVAAATPSTAATSTGESVVGVPAHGSGSSNLETPAAAASAVVPTVATGAATTATAAATDNWLVEVNLFCRMLNSLSKYLRFLPASMQAPAATATGATTPATRSIYLPPSCGGGPTGTAPAGSTSSGTGLGHVRRNFFAFFELAEWAIFNSKFSFLSTKQTKGIPHQLDVEQKDRDGVQPAPAQQQQQQQQQFAHTPTNQPNNPHDPDTRPRHASDPSLKS